MRKTLRILIIAWALYAVAMNPLRHKESHVHETTWDSLYSPFDKLLIRDTCNYREFDKRKLPKIKGFSTT